MFMSRYILVRFTLLQCIYDCTISFNALHWVSDVFLYYDSIHVIIKTYPHFRFHFTATLLQATEDAGFSEKGTNNVNTVINKIMV